MKRFIMAVYRLTLQRWKFYMKRFYNRLNLMKPVKTMSQNPWSHKPYSDRTSFLNCLSVDSYHLASAIFYLFTNSDGTNISIWEDLLWTSGHCIDHALMHALHILIQIDSITTVYYKNHGEAIRLV